MQFDFLDETEAPEEQQDDVIARQFTEAERRFEKGQYYRLLLRENFFDNNAPEAAEVIEEIRVFIRERLAVLLGVQAERPKEYDLFSEDEVKILKVFAAEIGKRPRLMPNQSPKTEDKAAEREAPRLRKPSTASPQQPRREAQTKPVQSAESPAKRRKQKKRIEQPDGTILEIEGGQTYVVERNELGTEYRRNVTQQTMPPKDGPQPIPPLTSEQMMMVAGRHDAEVQRAAPLTRSLISSIK